MAAVVLTRVVVGALLAVLVGCGAAPEPPPSFAPPRWSEQDRSELPAELASLYVRAAIGWDGGLLVAGDYPEPALFSSPDGRKWTEQAPEGFGDHLRGQPFAAYGSTAYVLGGAAGEVAVWRTEDGTTWQRTPLPYGDLDDPFMAIAAGPHGVLVVGSDGFDYAAGLEAEHTPEDFFGFEFWHSADGEEFRYAGDLTLARTVIGITPRVVATDDGFLLHDSGAYGVDVFREDTPLYRSTDGESWQYVGDGLPIGTRLAVGRAGSLTFVLGQSPSGLYARYRRDGDSGWSDGAIDLGRLPDDAVVPATGQWPTAVHPWGTGFIAIGRTERGEAGLVWSSPDGITWTRSPVRGSGFDRLAELVAVASSRGETLLFGLEGFPPDVRVHLWRAGPSG
ncbi:hypothetical protein IOD16_29040 [Saccharothrix sp. 6-C]|uniref:hypothetical protein n=1 Tax=Saccharothrix TaxID=2071 RepID=UPI000F4B1E7A|nr:MULTISPECIES: hypothetical protein [Saccharothrix]QQQ75123.1 hypothetical protein IOD16_29040 [Saccharothrix sp. 6-C]